MHRAKREIIAAEASGDEDMLTAKSILLRRQREEYAKFSKEAGLLTQNERRFMALGSRLRRRHGGRRRRLLTMAAEVV